MWQFNSSVHFIHLIQLWCFKIWCQVIHTQHLRTKMQLIFKQFTQDLITSILNMNSQSDHHHRGIRLHHKLYKVHLLIQIIHFQLIIIHLHFHLDFHSKYVYCVYWLFMCSLTFIHFLYVYWLLLTSCVD